MARTRPRPPASALHPATGAAQVAGPVSSTDQLRLSASISGNQALVVVDGEVDIATAPQLANCLQALERHGPLAVVVDLHGVSFLDVAGLRTLVAAHARLRRHGGQLVLTSPSRQARCVLDVTGLDTLGGSNDRGWGRERTDPTASSASGNGRSDRLQASAFLRPAAPSNGTPGLTGYDRAGVPGL